MIEPPRKVVRIVQGLNNPQMQPNYEINENDDRNQQSLSQYSSSVNIGEDVNSNPGCVSFFDVILALKAISVFRLEALMLPNRYFLAELCYVISTKIQIEKKKSTLKSFHFKPYPTHEY